MFRAVPNPNRCLFIQPHPWKELVLLMSQLYEVANLLRLQCQDNKKASFQTEQLWGDRIFCTLSLIEVTRTNLDMKLLWTAFRAVPNPNRCLFIQPYPWKELVLLMSQLYEVANLLRLQCQDNKKASFQTEQLWGDRIFCTLSLIEVTRTNLDMKLLWTALMLGYAISETMVKHQYLPKIT